MCTHMQQKRLRDFLFDRKKINPYLTSECRIEPEKRLTPILTSECRIELAPNVHPTDLISVINTQCDDPASLRGML